MIFVNDMPIKRTIFPGGEVHVEVPFIDPKNEVTKVRAHLHSSENVMELLLAMSAIFEQGVGGEDIELFIPYFPYARQDRVCGFGQSFSLQVMADLINSFGCKKVTVLDPHSKVLKNLLDNINIITQRDLILYGGGGKLLELIRKVDLVLVSPDEGASTKLEDLQSELYSEWDIDRDIIFCEKTRQLTTGKIIKTIVPKEISDNSFLIIDDICDGGRTFIEIAKKAKTPKNGSKRYLYITHGIFSQGLDYLKPYFNHIFCVHCFLPQEVISSEKAFLTVLKYKE